MDFSVNFHPQLPAQESKIWKNLFSFLELLQLWQCCFVPAVSRIDEPAIEGLYKEQWEKTLVNFYSSSSSSRETREFCSIAETWMNGNLDGNKLRCISILCQWQTVGAKSFWWCWDGMHSSELGIVSDNCAEQRRICQPLFPHAKSKMAGNLLFIFLGNANLRSRFRLIHLRWTD